MRIVGIALAALLAGCSESNSMQYDDARGQDDLARQCTLDSVEIVADHSEVVAGFASAPEQWISEMTGVFKGDVETSYGKLDGQLHVDYNVNEVRVVSYTWDNTDTLCAAWYEIGFGAGLSVGAGQLDEMFAATLLVDAGDDANFLLDIPVEDLRGTMRPQDFEDNGTTLRIEGDFKQLNWRGDLAWLGEIDDYEAWEDIGEFSFSLE